MAVDEEEAALRDENRSEVYILSNPGTMSTQRHSLQSRTATLAPQPAPALHQPTSTLITEFVFLGLVYLAPK